MFVLILFPHLVCYESTGPRIQQLAGSYSQTSQLRPATVTQTTTRGLETFRKLSLVKSRKFRIKQLTEMSFLSNLKRSGDRWKKLTAVIFSAQNIKSDTQIIQFLCHYLYLSVFCRNNIYPYWILTWTEDLTRMTWSRPELDIFWSSFYRLH